MPILVPEELFGHGPVDLADAPEEVRALIERRSSASRSAESTRPVAALGGLTPRQALDDPIRREELLVVLREMRDQPAPDGAVGMSVDPVERLLGIERS